MAGVVHVLLPASAAHLAPLVRDAGAVPVVDATGSTPPVVPDGAWVRTRPGRPAPGTGPVILAEFGAPVPDRPTWLETIEPVVPHGFAGIVLKGREAGGLHSDTDGLVLLAQCQDRSRVILDAGVGPRGAGAAAALGAHVLIAETHLGCPEFSLPAGLSRRLELADAEATRSVNGLRVGNSPTAAVLRQVLEGRDPWGLSDGVWTSGDLQKKLWLIGQGVALARPLAERYGTLAGLLQAYVKAIAEWPRAVQTASASPGRPVSTAAGLAERGTAATTGGVVGSGVLWEEASWTGRAIHGAPLELMVAFGGPIAADDVEIAAARQNLLRRAPALPDVAAPASAPSAAVVEDRPAGEASAPRSSGAIAIIGMGGRFPGANSVADFWSNIKAGVSAIGDVPKERWDPALYFDNDKNVPDKTYSIIGGFLRDFKFEPKRFRIPPKVAKQIDPVQQITLMCVADALEDAGLQVDRGGAGKAFDRERTAVILGNSLGGEVKDEYAKRVAWPEVRQKLLAQPDIQAMDPTAQDKFFAGLKTTYIAGLPEIDEDSMPGELSNVIAGRITNAFDFAGANFTVDAACASSMAAVQAACKGLIDGDFDVAISGGADRSMNIATFVKFSKIGALSPDHSSPFDASANGFVMGEGCGILILKRLEDAVRDGDRVYAVIRGTGASSDGKGKGITAPNINGQLKALERAYTLSGVDPATVDLLECHGTSTVVGDKIEVEAVSQFIGANKRGERGPIRIGSVKSMIGHLKSAAGAASLVKTALALHHGVLPPSIGYREAREDVPLGVVPLAVQTHAEPWPQTPDGIRRAGVSSFGFGGTNFHMVLESWAGQRLPQSRPATPLQMPTPASLGVVEAVAAAVEQEIPPIAPVERDWPEGLWVASANDTAGMLDALRRLEAGQIVPFNPSAPLRISAAADSVEEFKGQLERAMKVIEKGSNPDMLRARGIHFEDGACDGKLAMVFTGQGSQYIGMGLDLAEHFPIVRQTFEQADAILTPELGRGITDLIRLNPGETEAEKEELLRQTEYSQPATLTVDVAILRLLASYGVRPDMVAGHSLGEYAACVAAGIMTFENALFAVTARGREMANIQLDDPGKMAGIAASTEVVEEVLADVNGYVIAANKNCPSQTVIAGASDAVDEAAERFRARGMTVYPLPVSHAFHSAIVAPASEPLRGVLKSMGLKAPIRPITTNVTAEYYPTGPDAEAKMIDLLARQISSPVEWTAQIEKMYADGARTFIEIGPKRALTGFIVSILKRRPHRALYTNHPKRTGLWSLRDALAGLLVAGLPLSAEPAPGIPDLLLLPGAKRATTEALAADLAATKHVVLPPLPKPVPAVVAAPAPLISDAAVASFVEAAARAGMANGDAQGFARALLPAVQGLLAAAFEAAKAAAPAPAPVAKAVAPVPAPIASPAPAAKATPSVSVVCSGASIGLPGGDEMFAPNNVQAILNGENRISNLGDLSKVFLNLGLVRLHKDPQTGEGTFHPVTELSDVIRLAGVKSFFDPSAYGLSEELVRALDITSQLAIAAGIEALRDAGIPLVRGFREGSGGKKVPTGWMLPEGLRDTTGVIFASAFPGYDQLISHLKVNGDDGEGHFDRRLLFQILSMGHSQFAQFIGARGPNTAINAACASTTQAIVLAHDWLKLGRCERVIVIGADDVTNENLLPWIGGGFISAGAATTHDKVEEAALPFDKRRHGMILGMGAVGFVVETAASCADRGVNPIAELVGTAMANSAFHGSRLDPAHIAAVFQQMIGETCRIQGVSPATIAKSALFMSHETYTPARGGSAAAEIAALRGAFGADARQITIANTKGFTGHPMGAGIEDAIAVKALQYGRIPPIANFREADDDLGDLRISKGETRDVQWAIRLAAGFGSQLALTVWKRIATGDNRYNEPVRRAWLKRITGYGGVAETIGDRTLRASEGPQESAVSANIAPVVAAPVSATPVAAAAPAKAPSPGGSLDPAAVEAELVSLIALKTGYAKDEIDPTFELEADLGIDTVKQAEIFSALRERYDVPRDAMPTGRPTVRSLAEAIAAHGGSGDDPGPDGGSAAAIPAPDNSSARADNATTPDIASKTSDNVSKTPNNAASTGARDVASVLAEVVALVALKTGYESSEIEPDFELEADLGIDTVKQAEISSALRDRYGIARDDMAKLTEKPTVRRLAELIAESTPSDDAPPAMFEAEPSAESRILATPSESAVDRVSAAPTPEPAPVAASRTTPAPAPPVDSFLPDEDPLPDASAYENAPTPAPAVSRWATPAPVRGGGSLATPVPAGARSQEPVEIRLQQAVRLPSDMPTPTPATPRSATPAPAAPRAEAAARPATDAEREAMLGELLTIVAGKTGYEPSDLEPDFELEADLGVDTVKQAEIFGQLRDRHGLARDDQFRLSDYPTLKSLAYYLAERVAQGAVVAPGSAPAAADPEPAPPKSKIDPGKLFLAEEFDLSPGEPDPEPEDGFTTVALPLGFRVRRPVLIERPLAASSSLEGRRVLVLGTDRRAEAVRLEVAARGATLDAPYNAVIDAADDVSTAFKHAKELDAERPRTWVTLGRLGDLDGIYPLDRAFSDGARAGFAKALGREWPETTVRIVGFQGGSSEEEAARAACDELAAAVRASGPLEVFRKGPERRVIAYRSEAVPRPGMLIDSPVVLITGGGRGISARIGLELARRGPVRLALVGRGPTADEELDVNAEKERIKAALKATSARVTPVDIEKRLEPMRRADEIRKNIVQMEALGAEVKYFRADLADEAAIAAMLEEVEAAIGPVDVVIHGAGVEESRKIADKDDEAFRRVFDGKAKGGLALLKLLAPEVYFVSMGSVAGRFGNAGQVDYAAANDALARVCLTRPHSLHIDWTAWDDVGMAVRGGMRGLLSEKGVDLLPADAGAGLLVDLLTANTTGELVVAGRMGDFSPSIDHPLLDRVELEGDLVRGFRELSIVSDPWIVDHSIDDTPVLPGVIGVELMTAAASFALPGKPFAGASHVKFDQPVKVYKDQPVLVIVEAQPLNDRDVACKLISERTLRTGRLQRTVHFEATLHFGEFAAEEPLPSTFFPDEVIPKNEIYRRFFHGPRFQVLDGVDGVGTDGIIATGRVDDTLIADFLLTEPLLLEAAFQAAGLHRLLTAHEMGLPAAVESVRLLRPSPSNERLTVVAYFDGERYDVDVDGPDGPILRVRGFKLIDRGPIPEGERFPEPDGGRPPVFEGTVKKAAKARGARAQATADENPHPWLTDAEIAAISSRGTERRIRDRLAGRIAAKRALVALTGLPAHALEIHTAASGEPVVRGCAAHVSISHREGRAIAVAVPRGRVGVDLEAIAPRNAAFVEDWYTVGEQNRFGSDSTALTIAWTVKEAVQKALGAGMAVDPRHIDVQLGIGVAAVTLSASALPYLAAVGGGTFTATWAQSDLEIIAEVRLAA